MEPSSLTLILARVFFAFLLSSHFSSALSLDDSFLSSSSFNQQQRLQKLNELSIPGIWKLTTDALPYELDIRSKLDKQFSTADNDNNNENTNVETILLKLNRDGTFKQYDEGYREGRWVTGRWKLQLIESKTDKSDNDVATATQPTLPSTNSTDNDKSRSREKKLSWILLLAMNRQYFGPPYDVLLEAVTNTTSSQIGDTESKSSTSSVQIGNGKKGSIEKQKENKTKNSLSTALKQWQGMVQKGKFLRPAPGKHPLDREKISTKNEILVDAESLGIFSLEQALSTTLVNRKGNADARTNSNKEENQSLSASESGNPNDSFIVDDNDGTFFFPCSSSDDGGVLQ